MTPQRVAVSITMGSIFTIMMILLLLWFLYIIRDVIALVFIAFVVASAVDPWVDALEQRRIPRIASIATFGILLLGLLSLAIVVIVPPLIGEVRQLATGLPDALTDVERFFLRSLGGTDALLPTLQKNLQSVSQSLLQISSGVFGALSGVFGGVASTLTVLVISFYLTVEERGIRLLIRSVSPRKHHDSLVKLVDTIQYRTGRWLRGQLLLSLLVGLVAYVGLTLLGVPYPLMLSLLVAFLRIIPYIGPILSVVPAVLLALTVSPLLSLGVAVFFLVYNQLIDAFVVPNIMRQTIDLHPVLILILLLIGARLGGIVGIILAVPLGMIASIVLQERFAKQRSRDNALHEA